MIERIMETERMTLNFGYDFLYGYAAGCVIATFILMIICRYINDDKEL